MLKISILIVFSLFSGFIHGEESNPTRDAMWHYEYIDRNHEKSETWKHLGIIYAASWALYPLTQPTVFKDNGSFKNYGNNFGEVVFDRDTPFWNWLVHPISGSQLYLYYRANGYNRIDSVGLTFISSTLFEFTVEVYTEPASIQDLYQTPILGSILGYGIENLSLWLLNTNHPIAKFLGHTLNPSTMFGFFEGKVRTVPSLDGKGGAGVTFIYEF
ncbi:MAG: hypothetical protein COW01_00500 [Bdellovibrionales bacterium CG12_big_fil_rev_8_21_14_0_65_38_15]|nr:MAG: hypothetical protein COW79_10030 [Bdellovibrionales bacterium CG22_combo_CG10-13_8_21_14_all_38_13]PIQ57446.1 MAG: hypothetical protein COW01_00500 [Bdellovibrionales bacterium CG12_big_fil_rev_8_21_14_0_65_38_15]PIR31167.1 MAG: hypothetical protein COV38_01980 [Bdellovibrionales bacterium CG11_big_fil_rev_8_21_14_0_20_38_13]